ncbi:MAG: hypothetical protein GC164_14970 [Phycisphaera sp.]|nr:hypothetical protein [Phycisphaera sp.]
MRPAVCAVLGLVSLGLTGCNILGWVAHGVAGDNKTTVRVNAEYTGLANQSVAVLVSADEYTLYRYPDAPLAVGKAIAGRIATGVEGVTVLDPNQVFEFQRRNSYWDASPYSQLLEKLKVSRIVHVDLVQYTTHEPGNKHVWQGVIVGQVYVASSQAEEPNNAVYASTVKSAYPPDRPLGVVDADEREIELGTLNAFGQAVADLFQQHEETKD